MVQIPSAPRRRPSSDASRVAASIDGSVRARLGAAARIQERWHDARRTFPGDRPQILLGILAENAEYISGTGHITQNHA